MAPSEMIQLAIISSFRSYHGATDPVSIELPNFLIKSLSATWPAINFVTALNQYWLVIDDETSEWSSSVVEWLVKYCRV